ncbi:hypothetical protein CDN99_15870 [Roseateles aquatilis]|uniref:GGDEF domain-containing protein n=1 Tax=Roseateles aquatilis TaxID=431061 RepID=A0A246J8I0_9BURK|nr:diguanylate cyclase [Burkholderiaceae bacterium]OWQ88944.1 hypothetical protein CDN99_15870 [Roseateles aquatilis]
MSGHRNADAAVARVKAALTNPFAMMGGHRVPISSSFGYALSSEHGSTADELLRHADRLMYDAKRGDIEQRIASDQRTSNGAEKSRSLQEAEG